MRQQIPLLFIGSLALVTITLSAGSDTSNNSQPGLIERVKALEAFKSEVSSKIGGLKENVKVLEAFKSEVSSKIGGLKENVKVLEASDKKRGTATPIGVIQAFYGNKDKIPDGWLLCDGQTIPDEYKSLKKICGKRTPDLGGVFLRCADYGDKYGIRKVAEEDDLHNDEERSRDPDLRRPVGSLQAQSFKKHTHNIGVPNTGQAVGRANGDITSEKNPNQNLLASPKMYGFIKQTGATELRDYKHSDSNTFKALESGGNETRPINIAVNYIIKAK